jgi:CRP/FNR family transcriptional regulator
VQGGVCLSRCALCLRELPVFDGLSSDEFRNVCIQATKHTVKKGEYLFRQNELANTIYLVKDGIVKLVQYTEEGKEVILDIVGRGQVLGEEALFNKQHNIVDAIALETISVCSFSLPQLEALIRNKPNIAISIITNLGQKFYSAMEQLGATANHSIKGKLLALFFRLAKEHGSETANGHLIEINLTQEDLANMIGASRVMVAQLIKQFKFQGFISKKGRYYVIHDKCLLSNFEIDDTGTNSTSILK